MVWLFVANKTGIMRLGFYHTRKEGDREESYEVSYLGYLQENSFQTICMVFLVGVVQLESGVSATKHRVTGSQAKLSLMSKVFYFVQIPH